MLERLNSLFSGISAKKADISASLGSPVPANLAIRICNQLRNIKDYIFGRRNGRTSVDNTTLPQSTPSDEKRTNDAGLEKGGARQELHYQFLLNLTCFKSAVFHVANKWDPDSSKSQVNSKKKFIEDIFNSIWNDYEINQLNEPHGLSFKSVSKPTGGLTREQFIEFSTRCVDAKIQDEFSNLLAKVTIDAELTQMISTLHAFLIHHTNENLSNLTPKTLEENLTTTLNAIKTHVKTIQANGGLGDFQWNHINSCITQYPSNGNTLNTLKLNLNSRSLQGNSRPVDRFGDNGRLVDDIIKTLEQLKSK